MALKGRDPVRTKTVIDNKITEQVNLFNYEYLEKCDILWRRTVHWQQIT